MKYARNQQLHSNNALLSQLLKAFLFTGALLFLYAIPCQYNRDNTLNSTQEKKDIPVLYLAFSIYLSYH
jgi:hypothetical protein